MSTPAETGEVAARPRAGAPRSDGSVGPRLRERRAQLGLSLRELARRLEVSPSLVSQIETGKIQPSVRTLYAMVSELGVSLDDVFAAGQDEAAPAPADPAPPAAQERTAGGGAASRVQRAESRQVI